MTAIPDTGPPVAQGFAAAARHDARVLVLGSLPGVKSIIAGEYYAHPRNAFWEIVEDLYAIPRAIPYKTRIVKLNARGIALWDVLGASRRKGSLDSAIDAASAVPNDFAKFFARHPRVELVAFNGKTAARLYRRHVAGQLSERQAEFVTLPSTSPAHAAISYAEKLRQWQEGLSKVNIV
ncbi:MAG: DNA-deoxyinosine glycosylase [Woeseia sp.]